MFYAMLMFRGVIRSINCHSLWKLCLVGGILPSLKHPGFDTKFWSSRIYRIIFFGDRNEQWKMLPWWWMILIFGRDRNLRIPNDIWNYQLATISTGAKTFLPTIYVFWSMWPTWTKSMGSRRCPPPPQILWLWVGKWISQPKSRKKIH